MIFGKQPWFSSRSSSACAFIGPCKGRKVKFRIPTKRRNRFRCGALSTKAKKRDEEKQVELEVLKDFVKSYSRIGDYYLVEAPAAPVPEFMFTKRRELSSMFEETVSVIRTFEVDVPPASKCGVKVALDWKRTFIFARPSFDAVDDEFKRSADRLNSDKTFLKMVSDLKPSLLEVSYVGSQEGGPGIYGVPEVSLKKPTMSIELKFIISRMMNIRKVFLLGLEIIQLTERSILE